MPTVDNPKTNPLQARGRQLPPVLRRTLSDPAKGFQRTKNTGGTFNELIAEQDGFLERLRDFQTTITQTAVMKVIEESKETTQQNNELGTTPKTESKGVQTALDNEHDSRDLLEETIRSLKNELQQKEKKLTKKNEAYQRLEGQVSSLQSKLDEAQKDISREKAMVEVTKRLKDKEKDKEIGEIREASLSLRQELVRQFSQLQIAHTHLTLCTDTLDKIDKKAKGPGFEEIQGLLKAFLEKTENLLDSRGSQSEQGKTL